MKKQLLTLLIIPMLLSGCNDNKKPSSESDNESNSQSECITESESSSQSEEKGEEVTNEVFNDAFETNYFTNKTNLTVDVTYNGKEQTHIEFDYGKIHFIDIDCEYYYEIKEDGTITKYYMREGEYFKAPYEDELDNRDLTLVPFTSTTYKACHLAYSVTVSPSVEDKF